MGFAGNTNATRQQEIPPHSSLTRRVSLGNARLAIVLAAQTVPSMEKVRVWASAMRATRRYPWRRFLDRTTEGTDEVPAQVVEKDQRGEEERSHPPPTKKKSSRRELPEVTVDAWATQLPLDPADLVGDKQTDDLVVSNVVGRRFIAAGLTPHGVIPRMTRQKVIHRCRRLACR